MKHLKIYEKYDADDDEKVARDEFINYMLDCYGPEGSWEIFFGGNLTKEIILIYVDKFIRTRTRLQMWGRGDSFDREMFRDVLFVKLGIDYDTEHDVSQYITAKERREIELLKNKKQYNL